MVQINTDILGNVIKTARQRAGITATALANRLDITERYLYRIENENQKPSFDILSKLVRELSISADLIFYPEKQAKDSQIEDLIRMLYSCDERSIKIIRATVNAVLDSQTE